MDSIFFPLAFGPLAVYLLLFGWLNLSRRPVLMSGTRDIYALGVAVSGMVFVGPFNLFLPEPARIRFGFLVWLLVAVLYVLCVILLTMLVRPRLVIYNMTLQQLGPVLTAMMDRMGWKYDWSGNILTISQLKVQCEIDSFSSFRNIVLRGASAGQSCNGWQRFGVALRAELKVIEVVSNPLGKLMVCFGLLGLSFCCVWIFAKRSLILQGFFEIL